MFYTLGFEPLKPHYRTFCSYWWKDIFNPKKYYNFVKHFLQRGYRGYANCDYWNANSYLETVIAGVLKDLRDHGHGYPMGMGSASDEDFSGVDEASHAIDETPSAGMLEWQAILSTIIDGLEAAKDLAEEITVPDGVYSKNPLEFKKLENAMHELISDHKFDKELWESWRKPLLLRRAKATKLILHHWPDFWD